VSMPKAAGGRRPASSPPHTNTLLSLSLRIATSPTFSTSWWAASKRVYGIAAFFRNERHQPPATTPSSPRWRCYQAYADYPT